MTTVAEVEARAREVSLNGIKNARREDSTMANSYEWNSVTEITRSLHLINQQAFAMADALARSTTDCERMITQMYRYAGAEPAMAQAKSGQMMREMVRLRDDFLAAQQHIKGAKAIVRAAVDFMEEAEAQRKTARAKLGN